MRISELGSVAATLLLRASVGKVWLAPCPSERWQALQLLRYTSAPGWATRKAASPVRKASVVESDASALRVGRRSSPEPPAAGPPRDFR